MRYVIVGNSTAAVGCIEGIRKFDTESEIVIISSEKYHTYSRPLISYLLCGKTSLERMKYRPNDFYEVNGCRLLTDTTVVKIEADKKKVILNTNEEIEYDKLLVATGSRPFIPVMEGMNTVENVHTFMSLDDAQELEKSINNESRVLIIGAGLIGLKCAEGILNRVKEITVVDLADRILPSILNETASDKVKQHLEKVGIKFILKDSVKCFDKQTACLNGGEKLEFDVLVIAVGVRPNTELVKQAGGEVNRGIVVDSFCKTNLSDVYAAGDCTESFDITVNQNRILALLPNAYMQGECAGINMSSGVKKYDNAIPMNSMGLFGMHIITAGVYEGDSYVKEDEDNYKALFYKDNKLKGYILIGDVARAGIYTSIIRKEVHLDSIDFDLLKEKPQLMAFTKKDRKELLG